MIYQPYFYKKINTSEGFDPEEETEEISGNDCFDTQILDSIAAVVGCIFVIGLINNILACIVIISSKSMHTVANCYLFSLSMSDIFLLVTSTTQEMLNIYNPSQLSFGLVACALKNWAAEMSLTVSILSISAFTVERYLAICHPFYAKVTSQFSRAVKILIATWLLAALWALAPALETQMDYEIIKDCYLDMYFAAYYLEVTSIVFFIVPMILITIMYIRIWVCLKKSNSWKNKNNSKSHESHSPTSRNTVKMFVMIVVTFFVCWTPFHVQRLIVSHIVLYVEDVPEPDPSFDLIMCILKHGSLISYMLTAVIDPIIYSIMSVKFRQASKDLLSKKSNAENSITKSTKTSTARISQYSNRTQTVE